MRKLPCAVLVVGFFFHTLAFAVEFNPRLEITSHRGQPLDATLWLEPRKGDEAQLDARHLIIRLVSQDVVGQYGVGRHYLGAATALLDFEVLPANADGALPVRVTSRRAIQQPHVTFAVEAIYRGQSVSHGYSAYLTPELGEQQYHASAVNRNSVDLEVLALPDITVSYNGSSDLTTVLLHDPYSGPQWIRARFRPLYGLEYFAVHETEGGYFYRIQPGDILGYICLIFQPREYSLQQVMQTVYAYNPAAFIGGNMNELRVGAEIFIPKLNLVAGVEHEYARQQLRQQTLAWLEHKHGLDLKRLQQLEMQWQPAVKQREQVPPRRPAQGELQFSENVPEWARTITEQAGETVTLQSVPATGRSL